MARSQNKLSPTAQKRSLGLNGESPGKKKIVKPPSFDFCKSLMALWLVQQSFGALDSLVENG
jgi:hypothetical protein